jgi:hypothetical protein
MEAGPASAMRFLSRFASKGREIEPQGLARHEATGAGQIEAVRIGIQREIAARGRSLDRETDLGKHLAGERGTVDGDIRIDDRPATRISDPGLAVEAVDRGRGRSDPGTLGVERHVLTAVPGIEHEIGIEPAGELLQGERREVVKIGGGERHTAAGEAGRVERRRAFDAHRADADIDIIEPPAA